MDYRKIIKNQDFRFKILDLFRWVPDRLWLKLLYRIKNGYWMDFDNPKTFNEKLQWLKVYGFRSEYTQMVDKYAAKDYVASRIGSQYIIPTLGVWDNPEDIDWSTLPEKFVLKLTTGGGSTTVWIVKDKASFDCEDWVKMLRKRFPKLGQPHKRHISAFREHPYDDVPTRIIAEELLVDQSGKTSELSDYKFYCFNGEPVYCQVIRDRSTKETIDFYDMDWNHMPFVGLNPVARPGNLEDMIRVCRVLAKDIPFARIDLYEVNGKEYFGEITFYPAGGFGTFDPAEWNMKLGDLLSLEGVSGGGKFVRIESGEATIVDADLRDYKFFCFNGKVRFFKVDFGRFTEHRANYYSPDCKLLPYGEMVCQPDPTADIQMPENLDKMIELAEKLSAGIPFLRVDLYNVNGRIYFGELTFYPAGGLSRWTDDRWDHEIGEMLNLK